MSVQVPYRVIYADTDMMGVMYHANYFRLFEYGRNEFSRKYGWTYKKIEEAGFILPVVECSMKYMKPALYDDMLTVHVWLRRKTRIRLEFGCRILRGDEVLATGTTLHACLDKNGRPARLWPGFEDTFPVTGEHDDAPVPA